MHTHSTDRETSEYRPELSGAELRAEASIAAGDATALSEHECLVLLDAATGDGRAGGAQQ